MKKYKQVWWKSGTQRGECWQVAECDVRGNPAKVVGYVDDAGNDVVIPDPHEAVSVGNWEATTPAMFQPEPHPAPAVPQPPQE